MSEPTFSSGDIAAVAEKPAATPEASPATDPAPASTTPDPAPTAPAASAVVSDSPKGEPPPERWPDILDNARKKAREEVETEYAWAKGIDRQELDAARSWMALASRDPVLALDRFVQSLANDPQHQQSLRSYFGRSLGTRVNADPMPGPDIPTDQSNGEPVVYSAAQMQKLLDWKDRQFKRTLDQELGPFRQEREQTTAQREAAQYSAQHVNAVAEMPGFKDHVTEIRAAYAAIPLEDPRTEGEKLRDAYLSVVGPKLTQQARQQAVTDIHRKVSASTINPASATATEPYDFRKSRDFTSDDIAQVWKQKAAR